MKAIALKLAVNTDAWRTTHSRMMITVKQIAARRNITRPALHLRPGMA